MRGWEKRNSALIFDVGEKKRWERQGKRKLRATKGKKKRKNKRQARPRSMGFNLENFGIE